MPNPLRPPSVHALPHDVRKPLEVQGRPYVLVWTRSATALGVVGCLPQRLAHRHDPRADQFSIAATECECRHKPTATSADRLGALVGPKRQQQSNLDFVWCDREQGRKIVLGPNRVGSVGFIKPAAALTRGRLDQTSVLHKGYDASQRNPA